MKINRLLFLCIASLLCIQLHSFAQSTVNCNGLNPWSSTQTYNTESVFYNGVLYQSKYNNVNLRPDLNNATSGQPWQAVGTCSTPISPASVSCSNLSTWSASTNYAGGAVVIWNGYKYTAKWSNSNEQPDVNSPDQVWQLNAACQSNAVLTVNSSSLTAFTTAVGNASTAQSFTISGSNLSAAVTITAPPSFEVSLSQASGYTSNLSITPASGSITSTTVYVIYSPSAIGTDNGNIVISSTGVTTQNIVVTGTATGLWIANGTAIYNGNSGNVGIGTLNPLAKLNVNGTTYLQGVTQVGSQRVLAGHTDYKFSVDGKITCQKLVATPNNWADTVFSEGYVPMRLEDIEQFVQENKHLPEIPSEQEVKEKGIDVGEMNTLLLKKVEELTLYIIELNERMKQLEAEKK